MAVSYVTSNAFASSTGQSSYSPSYTLQNGSGDSSTRLIVVAIAWEDGEDAIVETVTFDGQAPTGSQSAIAGSIYKAYAWLGWWVEDDLPTTVGSKVVAVTADEAVEREIGVYVMEFTGVDPEGIVSNNTDTRTSAGTVSCSVTLNSDNSLGCGVYSSGDVVNGSAINLTERQSEVLTSSSGGCGSNENIDGASVTLGWTSMGLRGAFVGATFEEYIPVPASPTSHIEGPLFGPLGGPI
jgi:hypothetical protein